MLRHHTIRLTLARWADKPLRDKVIADARAYAGRNPGVRVVIKKQVRYSKPVIYEVWKVYQNHSGEPQDWSEEEVWC